MHDLVREIQAIAQTGLHYASDPFDQGRYARLRHISYELMSALGDAPPERFESFFVPETGYSTPKVDLRAAVIRDGHVLLVKERADGKWTLPGGWADQNESPIEGIVRETKEESGYDIAVTKLYAVKDRDRNGYKPKYPVSIYKLFFLAEIVGGRPEPNLEASQIAFFPAGRLPELSLDRVLPEDVHSAFVHANDPGLPTHVD